MGITIDAQLSAEHFLWLAPNTNSPPYFELSQDITHPEFSRRKFQDRLPDDFLIAGKKVIQTIKLQADGLFGQSFESFTVMAQTPSFAPANISQQKTPGRAAFNAIMTIIWLAKRLFHSLPPYIFKDKVLYNKKIKGQGFAKKSRYFSR